MYNQLSTQHLTAENQLLDQRGLLAIARQAEWQSHTRGNQSGWQYPVFDPLTGQTIGHRWKATQSGNHPKYLWIPNKPDHPHADWYSLPNTAQAIEDADGVCYLANGEPSLLAYHAAGIYNVIATTHGESSVPKILTPMLNALGVSRLLYPVDNDEAGEKSALKWRDALRGSGIDYVPLQWQGDVPAKADANDIWMLVNFDKSAFRQHLGATVELTLPAPEPKPEPKQIDFDRVPTNLIDAVARRLGISYWKSDGWARQNISSPFREDKNPSATFNRESGVLHDFGTGESYSVWQVADFLGIPYEKSAPKKSSAQADATKIPMSQWATPVRLPSFTADQRVHLRYISTLGKQHLHQRTLMVKSPLATGKTSLIERMIAQYEAKYGRKPSVLVQTHSQALVDNIAERLKIHSYLDVPTNDNPRHYLDGVEQIAISQDSLHLVSGRTFDLVFIDEFEQNMAHLSSGTMSGSQARTAYNTLCNVLRGAGQVMVCDAHLTDTFAPWLQQLRGQEGFHQLENTYRHQWGDLKLYAHKSAAIAHALRTAHKATLPIVITNNSRTETDRLHRLFAEALGDDGVFLINGWNSHHQSRRAFLANINQEITRYKVVICSPTIGTGIDIQAPVEAMYGLFSRDTWGSATTIMQQMMRFRNANQRHLYVQPTFDGNEETNPNVLYQRHIARANGTATHTNFTGYHIDAMDSTDKALLWIECLQKTQRALQRNNLFNYAIGYAKDEGFTPSFNEQDDLVIRDRLRDIRDVLKQEARDKTISLDPIDRQTFEQLVCGGHATRETYFQHQRWLIERTAGQGITDALYDLLRTPRLRADFKRFVDLEAELDQLHSRDREQALQTELLSKRSHFTRNRQLIVGALQTVFGQQWYTSTEQLTAEDITERLTPYLEAHLKDIQIYIDHRTDLSTDPVAILRRMLKRITLKLVSTQKRAGETRIRLYALDTAHLAQMQALAHIARQAKAEPVSKHDKYIDTKRVLSHSMEYSPKEAANPIREGVNVTLASGDTIHIPF